MSSRRRVLKASDLEAVATTCVVTLRYIGTDAWHSQAANVDWTIHETAAHIAEVLTAYAMSLTAQLDREWPRFRLAIEAREDAIDAVAAAAAVLGTAIGAAPTSARGWHPAGAADREGFTAMALDELIIHTLDAATAAHVDFTPPDDIIRAVLNRLFPWWPHGAAPLKALLWANGRGGVPSHSPLGATWLWHSRPLAEWDGTIPVWDPVTRSSRPAN
jgi:hypothetical protein